MAKGNRSLDQTLAKQEEFLIAFKKTNAIIAPACESIDISRQTYYRWMKDYLEFKQSVEDLEERQIDFVESQLQKGVRAGVPGLITFYLGTKGKKRGYVTRIEMEKREVEEFSDEDQAIMDDYAQRRVKEIKQKNETQEEKIARLKAEAIAEEDDDDDEF